MPQPTITVRVKGRRKVTGLFPMSLCCTQHALHKELPCGMIGAKRLD